jgi:hypothetical protein
VPQSAPVSRGFSGFETEEADSPLRAVRFNTSPFFRAIFAALLTLALLQSVVPLSVLSAAHTCPMPCCAGGACSTGACHTSLFKAPKKSEEEKLCGTEDEARAHGRQNASHHSMPSPETAAESDHCNTDRDEENAGTASREVAGEENEGSPRTASPNQIQARTLAAPCSQDCCGGATLSTQSRRGRDAALFTAPGKLPQAGFISLSNYSRRLKPTAQVFLEQLRARAPPLQQANLSA